MQRKVLTAAGAEMRTSRRGNRSDSAMVESLWDKLRTEMVKRKKSSATCLTLTSLGTGRAVQLPGPKFSCQT